MCCEHFESELVFSRPGLGLETDQDRVSKVLILILEHLLLILVFACTGLGLWIAGLGLGPGLKA